MSKHRNPRANRHSNYNVADLKNLARGRWPEILRAAGVPADAIDGHKGRPCPRCAGVDRYCPLPDFVEVGAVLCRHCHNASSEPRCGDGIATLRWWLGCDAATAVAWLADWIGVGIDGAERLAGAVMTVAPVRIVSPSHGAKDARAWVLAGADRSCIDATANGVEVRSIALEGVNHE